MKAKRIILYTISTLCALAHCVVFGLLFHCARRFKGIYQDLFESPDLYKTTWLVTPEAILFLGLVLLAAFIVVCVRANTLVKIVAILCLLVVNVVFNALCVVSLFRPMIGIIIQELR